MKRRVKGLYQRPDSGVFWASYQDASGRRVRESLKTNDRHTAERLLLDKLGRIARGEQLLPRADKIKYDELRGDLIVYYETRETRDLAEARARLKHLDRFFVGRRAVTINPDVVTKYAGERQKAGAANGTVNRELATLSKMLHLARANGKLQVVPVIEKLREADPRSGFVTREQFDRIAAKLPDELQVAALVAFALGWRKREVLDLQRRQLDLQAGTLRLDPGQTKNRDGRVAYLTPELVAALNEQLGRVANLQRAGRLTPWLFPHLEGPLAGSRILDPRKAWRAATKAAGLPGIMFHDLRRSAVRGMVAAGVPERVAMRITGHRTRSVFDRYHIVSDADLVEAAAKLAGKAATQLPVAEDAAAVGHVSGHVSDRRVV